MAIPTGSKNQEKTEERSRHDSPNNTTNPNAEERDTSKPPSADIIPPQSIIPSIFNFRTNFRSTYLNPISNNYSLPNKENDKNNNNGENESLSTTLRQPKMDEFCIQWCKQQDLNRDRSIVPECKMLCFRKYNNRFKHDLMKKMIAKEGLEQKQHYKDKHEVENVAQVLYNRDENVEEGNDNKSGNFLDGYYLYYFKGLEVCQKHTEDMKNDEISNHSIWLQNNPEEYEIDLGEKFEKTKSETKRIIKRAFTPGYQFAKRYFESWGDGTQSSFFKRFYESVQRMDAVHIMQDNVKKAVEVWVNGGNDSNEGIGRKSNEKNGDNGNDTNGSFDNNPDKKK